MSIPEVEKRVKAEIETIETIPDLKVIKPKVFPDDRGFFSETFNVVEWAEQLNYKEDFKQVRTLMETSKIERFPGQPLIFSFRSCPWPSHSARNGKARLCCEFFLGETAAASARDAPLSCDSHP